MWGGNGVTENLMCSGAREWRCWNSLGFNGKLATRKIVEVILAELDKLEGFDQQWREIVTAALKDGNGTHAVDSMIKSANRARESEEDQDSTGKG